MTVTVRQSVTPRRELRMVLAVVKLIKFNFSSALLTVDELMNIWLFQSLVLTGSVKDCRKWLDSHKDPDYAYSRCWSSHSTRGYACVQSGDNSTNNISTLQRISAEKVRFLRSLLQN
jgi:hypothetical protein